MLTPGQRCIRPLQFARDVSRQDAGVGNLLTDSQHGSIMDICSFKSCSVAAYYCSSDKY